MKKKFLMPSLCVALALSLTACGGSNVDTTNPASQESSITEDTSIAESKTENTQTQQPDTPKKAEPQKIKYISVTSDKLSKALSDNALKASDKYKDKHLKITGWLGAIDSDGKYISIKTSNEFDFTNIQCYIQSDKQKKVVLKKNKGDRVTVKGLCKDVGEFLGYSIDIESIK